MLFPADTIRGAFRDDWDYDEFVNGRNSTNIWRQGRGEQKKKAYIGKRVGFVHDMAL